MKKKKFKWQQWITMGFFMLIGAACGVLMVLFVENSAAADAPLWQLGLTLLFLLVLMYLAIFTQLVIHEAGHLVFGLISGYQFSSFRIGSFMWLKENGKIVHRRLSLAGTGGQCLMAPPERTDGKIPVVLYNLGGCIMNLVGSAAFFGLYLMIDRGRFLSIFSLMMTVIGVGVALMNGIPMRMGTVDNDGYNACSLRKSADAMYAFWLQMKVNEQLSRGVRLREMPEEWFALPSDDAMKNSMVATQGVFLCNRLMDQHRFEEADQLMAHLLAIDSGIIGLHRNLMICDRMYCELIRDNRQTVLEQMYDAEQKKFMKSMKKFPSVVRAEYAYALLAEQEHSKADASLALFEKIGKTYPYPSDIQSERELMEIAASISEKKQGWGIG